MTDIAMSDKLIVKIELENVNSGDGGVLAGGYSASPGRVLIGDERDQADALVWTDVIGNPAGSAADVLIATPATVTRQGQIDVLESFLGINGESDFVRPFVMYYARNRSEAAVNSSDFFQQEDWSIVRDHILAMQSTSFFDLVIAWKPGQQPPSENDDQNLVVFKWDASENDLFVVVAGDNYLVMDGTATDQAAVETFLDTLYPSGCYNWAVNLSTEIITIVVNPEGDCGDDGSFDYDVTLEETINLGDDLSVTYARYNDVHRGRYLK